MITLDKIIIELSNNNLIKNINNEINFSEIEINHITYNSKDIKGNTLFVCKGDNFKDEYFEEAISLGAKIYISETKYECSDDIIGIIVTDIREVMYHLGNLFYDYAWKKLKLIGLTGTKGKTTTTYFLKNILDSYLENKCAIISTIDTYTGTTNEKSSLTTPEALDLHKYFDEAIQNNLKMLVMEVASQGYKKKRVSGITFDFGAFLNISEDHISDNEHVDYNDYLNCKLEFMRNVKTAIININTDNYKEVLEASKNAEKIITFGFDESANYYLTNVRKINKYIHFVVNKENYSKEFKIGMPGSFNVENALVAIIIAKELGISDDIISESIINTKVKGRMNVFENDDLTVIVDYAHNKLSYNKLFESLKTDYPGRRIIAVGGCQGEKAYQRRREYGEIISSFADFMYLTADDPQREKVSDICNEIAKYIKHDNYVIMEDREEAVTHAFENSLKGDVIVLLSKGEEPFQKINGKLVPYASDIKLAENYINKIKV